MTEPEFQTYLERAVKEYAQEHVRAGNWDQSDALRKSQQEYRDLLPNGLESRNQHLFSVQDQVSGTKVGMIWFGVKPGPHPSAFIYDFWIEDQFRRQGYGAQTLKAVEEKVKEFGADSISLHVFGHNQAAINLYQKLGYAITSIFMEKKLPPGLNRACPL